MKYNLEVPLIELWFSAGYFQNSNFDILENVNNGSDNNFKILVTCFGNEWCCLYVTYYVSVILLGFTQKSCVGVGQHLLPQFAGIWSHMALQTFPIYAAF